ncbi:MAG: hypothetical protein AAGB29_01550 [Planctomycetota bacterium]
MTTFADQLLFDGTLDTVRIGPLRARQAVNSGIAGHGASVVPQGIEARAIDHEGRLVADSPAELQSRIAAIESFIDRGPHTLQLNDGRSLEDCVMASATFDPSIAVGPRTACRFHLEYLQLTPTAGSTP